MYHSDVLLGESVVEGDLFFVVEPPTTAAGTNTIGCLPGVFSDG